MQREGWPDRPLVSPPEEPLPTIVCILGMHRSGMSLITRMVNLLGVDLGPEEHLMRPGPDNPAGFWEHDALTALNDELLAWAGGSWDDPPAFPEGWQDALELADLRDRARHLLNHDFAGRRRWGWKDPRTCLTLPFWQRLLLPMRYVVSLRNPVDVARSLEGRNGLPPERSGALWATYVRAALEHSAGQARIFLFYEDVMTDWQRELVRLAAFLGLREVGERSDVQQLVRAVVEEERPSRPAAAPEVVTHPGLPAEARALYGVLRAYVRLVVGPEAWPESEAEAALRRLRAGSRRDRSAVARALAALGPDRDEPLSRLRREARPAWWTRLYDARR